MPNALNVTTGKGSVNGQIYRAPIGTPLPASATADLDAAFKSLGYVSDAGVVNSNSASTSSIKAWGGDVVLDVQGEKPDTFKFTLIEAMNPETLKAVYGNSNVSGDLENGIKIKANSQEQATCAWVIDMVLRDNALKRIVIAQGKVTTVSDITYADEDLVGYETTVSCYPNATQDGDTHQEFIVAAEEPTTYTVTFNTDGGSAVASQTVEEGETATQPTAPTKSGYNFKGWYSDAAKTTAYDFSTAITADTTIYAKWAEVFTVTFSVDGGSAVAAQEIEDGGLVTEPDDPTKNTYTFGGWYKEDTFTTAWDFGNDTVTADTTIYAKWE